ncbi:MAG: HPr kinase/phosphorylase [Alphaproteobacteria bacterium]
MSRAAVAQIHATAIAWRGRAVLLRGPSGSGKSDLALRLVAAGWRLVADDRCDLSVGAGRLIVSPPRALAGLIEARGVGIVRVPARARAAVALVVDLVPSAAVPRFPAPAMVRYLGIAVPRLRLAGFEASAPAKLGAALAAISTARAKRAIVRAGRMRGHGTNARTRRK